MIIQKSFILEGYIHLKDSNYKILISFHSNDMGNCGIVVYMRASFYISLFKYFLRALKRF